MTDNLRDCTLQSVADQCPSLRELVLRSSPAHRTRTTPEREPFHISDVLPKCPKLERLLISRSEVVGKAVFSKLVRESSDSEGQRVVRIRGKDPVLPSETVLILDITGESDAASCLKECGLYRAVLRVRQPFLWQPACTPCPLLMHGQNCHRCKTGDRKDRYSPKLV
jgi:hypothetical protein